MRRRRFVRVAVSAALVAGATTLLVGGETPAAFAAGPALVQTGSVVTSATTSVTLTLSSGSTSGNLLIATNVGWGSSNNVSGPAGWTSGVQTSGGLSRRTAILYYASNSGGITSAAFTFGSGTTFIAGQISEWSGMGTSTPIDVTNRANNGSGTSLNVSSGGNTTIEANEIAVTAFQEDFSSATTATFTPGASYTNFGNTGATSGTTLYTAEYETGLASGASPSETETSTVSATVGWLGAIATFAPPATCTGGSLTIGQPNGGVQFNGLNLNGKDRIDNAQPSWTPSDLTGSNAGWNIQLTSTLFTTGSHTLGAKRHDGDLGEPKYDGRDLYPAHQLGELSDHGPRRRRTTDGGQDLQRRRQHRRRRVANQLQHLPLGRRLLGHLQLHLDGHDRQRALTGSPGTTMQSPSRGCSSVG